MSLYDKSRLKMHEILLLLFCQLDYACLLDKLWYFVSKIVPTYCEKNCSIDREKLLKSEAEVREFAKIMRSLEQFIQTVKGQNNFW